MEERLKNLFNEILEFKIVNGDASADNIENWDSMNHLKLIMGIEREFDVRFNTEEIPLLNSYNKIIEALTR